MKKKLFILMLCFCALLTAFGQKKRAERACVVIEPVGISADSMSVYDPTKSNGIFFVKPDSKGLFVMQFHSVPAEVTIGFKGKDEWRAKLSLRPGDDFHIRTDFSEQTTFSGKGYEATELLYRYNKDGFSLFNGADWKTITANEVDKRFRDFIQRSMDKLEANKSKVSPDFYKKHLDELTIRKWYFLLGIAQICHGEVGWKLSASIPDNFWNRDKNIPLDMKFLSTEGYQNLIVLTYPLYSVYRERFQQGLIDSALSMQTLAEMMYKFMKERYSGELRSYAIKELFVMAFTWVKDPEVFKPLMDGYLTNYAVAKDAEELKLTYDNLLKTSVGQVPPFFVLKNQEGQDVTLKDFAGKVIYMDFWASWCGPCRQEMQNGSPKLHEKFKDNKDVVFLYVSIDDRADLWKKAIAADKIEGVHVLSAGGFKSPVAQAFNINGVPHYIIIGRDGKIFDNNAPRPSQDITVQKINDALSK